MLASKKCLKMHPDSVHSCIGALPPDVYSKRNIHQGEKGKKKFLSPFVPGAKKTCVCSYAKCPKKFRKFSQPGKIIDGKCVCPTWRKQNTKSEAKYVYKIVADGVSYISTEANALQVGEKGGCGCNNKQAVV